MITVTVYAIMFEKEYEFRLDPDVPVFELCEEIGEMICQKEQYEMNGNPADFVLFSKSKHKIFSPDSTLAECGVKTGDILSFG